MRRGLTVLNLLLLVGSWLLMVLGVYVSLLTGLAPTLGLLALLCWTVLTWLIYRASAAAPKPVHWRSALPGLFLAGSLVCFSYVLDFMRQHYIQEHGYPRRYYSWDTK